MLWFNWVVFIFFVVGTFRLEKEVKKYRKITAELFELSKKWRKESE